MSARDQHRRWPQRDAGIVFWSLSVAATDWQSCHRLARLCTVPNKSVVEAEWDSASYALVSKILRPLIWFGLLEHRRDDSLQAGSENRNLYRKTPLFDRFLKFNVTLEPDRALRH